MVKGKPVMAIAAVILAQIAAEAAGPAVRVEPVLGTPTFTLDGEPFLIPCFETYVPEERFFRRFAEAGVGVFSFNTNASACDYGHSPPTQPDPDTWDYSGFDERMRRVLAANPEALVLPRINLGTPRWWLDAHPEEMEVLGHGDTLYREPNRNPTLPKGRPFPSIASPVWRNDTSDALRRFLRHVADSPYARHVFGYILAGLDTEEWYPWSSGSDQLSGYGTRTRDAFRNWLRRKYGTAEALRTAWGQETVGFDTATVPSPAERRDGARGTFRDPATAMNVIDFYLFYNDLVPETIDAFARVVREETGGTKAIGAFYGYMYEFRGDPEYGHNALAAFNRSPNLDFIFVTASYNGRAPGTGGDYARGPAYSVRLHGKLWYHDNDVVSFLAPTVLARAGMTDDANWDRNLTHHLAVLGYTDTPLGTRHMYRRSLGFALCSGAYESYFDLHGGYYDHPELMDEVRILNRVAAAAATVDRSSASEILVVADETSCAYATFRNNMLGTTLLDTQHRLIKVGAPADHVLLSDLDRLDPERYRLVVFLNTYHISAAQRDIIREKLMNRGRHLLWCYAPGYFEDNRASAEAMRDLTGIRIVPAADPAPVPLLIRPVGANAGEGPWGSEACRGRLFSAADREAEVLGRHPRSGEPVWVRKDMGGWVSEYAVTAVLPPAFYRARAQEAGVHVFNDRDDTFYANRSYLTVHANGDGLRRLRFPGGASPTDAITGEAIPVSDGAAEIRMTHGETRILRWGGPPTPADREE